MRKKKETFSSALNRSKSLKEKGRYEEAEEEICRAFEREPDHVLIKISLSPTSFSSRSRKTPAQEIEEAVDLGIMETAETLRAPAYQEKLLPYLKGLEEIGRKEKASAIRRVLTLHPERSEAFLSELDEALTPGVIQGINEAFRGRVVVVNRNLDELYGTLIHRKYTLPQIKKILREWLKEDQISGKTFVHFVGQEGKEAKSSDQE